MVQKVKELFPVTVRLDKYDVRLMLALCRKHNINEDELFSQVLGLAATLAFDDCEFREVHGGCLYGIELEEVI